MTACSAWPGSTSCSATWARTSAFPAPEAAPGTAAVVTTEPIAHARIRLRVVPASRGAGIVSRYGEGSKVRVTAAPERGRANGELVRLLAEVLGVDGGAIEVIAGGASRDKIVAVRGMTEAQVNERLNERRGR